MNTNLATLDTDFDPATLGWPASLPLEIALRTASPAAIREAVVVMQISGRRS